MDTTAPLKVYLIAGEASGDALGAGLMRALEAKTGGNVQFFGIGCDKMRDAGLKLLFPGEAISLMGFAEILPHLTQLLGRIGLAAEDILLKQPDVVVTIDSPGFCFRVAQKLRKHDTSAWLMHYVAPSVWAYKPERAKLCADLYDHLLTLLPFEAQYFEPEGLPCTFVGHPAASPRLPKGDREAFRGKHGIADEAFLLCLLPGSRRGELARNLPAFGRTVALLGESCPSLTIVVPATKLLMAHVVAFFQSCPYRAIVVSDEEEKRNALAASDLALVKSGTASVEVTAAGIPQIVTYRAHPFSAWLMRRMIRIPHVTLVNIIAGKEVIPELLQELSEPIFLANALSALQRQPALARRQISLARSSLVSLASPHGAPSELAADVLLRLATPP